MTERVNVETRRLRRIFERALLVAAATPIAAFISSGCGDAPIAVKDGAGGGSAVTAAPSTATTGLGSTSGIFESTTGGDGVDAGADVMIDPCAPVQYTPVMAPDAATDDCGDDTYLHLACGLPPGVAASGATCYLFLKDCAQLCPSLFLTCGAAPDSCDGGAITPTADGAVNIVCSFCGGLGRVPAGLESARIARRSTIGDYFAKAAHLEAASVHAFRRLHGELAAHGASTRLLCEVRRAEQDEVRHARVTGRLARRFGGSYVRPRVAPMQTRALDVVAIENAVEGCVNETFGALVATFQAANAKDPEVARAMRGIALDETRHAALSWEISRWASRRLDAETRARLDAKCREAVVALRRVAVECDPLLAASAGLPSAEQRDALLQALEEQLWNPRARAA